MNILYFLSLFDKDIRRQARENAAQGKPLNIMQDIVFKAVFTGPDEDSREALRLLLQDCIRRPVKNAQVLNTEIIPDYLLGKTVRLDIHVTFNDGESCNVEMQTGGDKKEIRDRALIHAAKLLSAQAKKGRKWGTINRVYSIFFMNFTLFPESSKIPRRYTVMEESEHVKLNDTLELIFFEMPKLETFVQNYQKGTEDLTALRPEEQWCIYFKYRKDEKTASLIEALCQKSEGIMHAEKAARKISRSEEQWARAIFREKADMDYRSGLANARDDGIAIGLETGHEDILALMRQGYSADQIETKLKQK
jgi:predicted transposase/invertase (TIGR01784 family)